MAAPTPEATFNAEEANLTRSEQVEEGAISEKLGYQEAGVTNAENILSEREPAVYRGERNAMGKRGLFTSGINARAKTELATKFGSERARNQAKLAQYRAEAKRSRETGGIKREGQKIGFASQRAAGEAAITANNPGVEPPSAPQSAPTPQPGQGQWIGNVRTGGTPRQPPLSATRYYNPTTKRWETRI